MKLIATLFAVVLTIGCIVANDAATCRLPAVRSELAKRVKVDQDARHKLETLEPGQEGFDTLAQDIRQIDQRNTRWIRTQIDEHGWLGKTLVGEDGAHHAWLLVQHADFDTDFQSSCLKLMSAQPKGEVSGVDIAYLTDRILVANGKPQKYGTQATIENGRVVLSETEDPQNLDSRRLSLGLMPIEEYVKLIESTMQLKPNPDAG